MIYATFDEAGFPTGFYMDEWHGPRLRPVYGELITVPVFETPEPTEEDPEPEPVEVGREPDPSVEQNPPIIGEEPNPDTRIPADAILLTQPQYDEFQANEGARRWDGEKVVPYEPPVPAGPPVTLSAELLFFERMTDEEYDDLDDSIRSNEPARVYRGWSSASSFTEGTDIWALLVKHLSPDVYSPPRWSGVSDERRSELLAPPSASAAMAEGAAA